MDEQIYELEIDVLQPNPLQPRGLIAPDSLQELAQSIKAHGVLEPIVTAKTPAGYQIVAGERRWRAAKLIGLARVPVVIRETSPQGMLEMAIVENVQRIDLNPLERAQAYRRLMDEFGLANQEIADRVAKSPAYISNTIKLLILPDALKDALMAGATSEGHARALAALEDPHLIIPAYKEVLKKNLSVRATEELVRRIRVEKDIPPRNTGDIASRHIISEDIDKIQNDVSSVLSQRTEKPQVKCQMTGKRAKLEIIINGIPAATTPVLEDLHQAIVGYFNLLIGKQAN